MSEKAPYGSFINYMANRPLTEDETKIEPPIQEYWGQMIPIGSIEVFCEGVKEDAKMPFVDFPRSVEEAIGNSGKQPAAGNPPRCITESEMLHNLMSRIVTLESEIERLREFINEHVYGSK